MSKVLGLDLSLTGTGVVILDNGKIRKKELIRSKPIGSTPIEELKRIIDIVNRILVVVGKEKITMAAIEGLAFGIGKTTSLSQLTALNYFIRERLFCLDIPFVIVAPTSLKKFATGKGSSQKDQMMLEVYKRWGVSLLDNNICDAYALAQVARSITENPKLTQTQKEVIDLVKPQTYGDKKKT